MSCHAHRNHLLPAVLVVAAMFSLHGCASLVPASAHPGNYSGLSATDALERAREWQARAPHEPDDTRRGNAWLQCAVFAHDAMASENDAEERSAAALATSCSRAYLARITRDTSLNVHPGRVLLGERWVQVQFRGMPDSLDKQVHLELADQLSVEGLGGVRHRQPGFGVPVVAAAPPCTNRPICALYPPEGIFRPATVWLEDAPGMTAGAESPVLVVQSPDTQPDHIMGGVDYPLAAGFSAPYEYLLERSKLRRLGWWGLIGGQAIGERAGLFLLDDYDPKKTPVIMIHGLGSSPIIWGPLTNAIMGDAALRRRYQVWHVVYQSNAPVLIERHRVQGYLDAAWKVLDPGGSAPARQGVVLIGHSMGGVIARLLCAQSTPALWSSVFTVPFGSLRGDAAELSLLHDIFQFQPYPGVDEIIFMAAPQRGSPVAGDWLGRLVQDLALRHIPEMPGLERLVAENPGSLQASYVSGSFRIDHLSSVTSLVPGEPAMVVGDTLMPAAGIRYDSIAGVVPGTHPPSDGWVPLSSATLPGSASTLIVNADHHGVPRDPKTIEAVLAILRQHGAQH
ncbi:esterase/lipase family protein [Dyella mobilis]|uniref:Alpha/beta fold hydrolase n=1 Tax=Dyella mobilis TaxID=1849582 RepID=A0ABS2K9T2_9GAMM|nr:alpha/beta fold hydrolase [Dyella mobilis]MBM7127914.1 alpha/beta fold hydrolase [Dyella mobilis]